MTTVWPIVALGTVAAISALLPGIVVRLKRKRSITGISPTRVTSTGDVMRWPSVFVATTLPVVLMLLFLYAAMAQQPEVPTLWMFPVIILPVAMGVLYARRKIRHDSTGQDRE